MTVTEVSSIKDKVYKIIKNNIKEDITLSDTMGLSDGLGLDSLSFMEMVMCLEEEFSIEMPDEDLEKIKTISCIIKYIENKIKPAENAIDKAVDVTDTIDCLEKSKSLEDVTNCIKEEKV